MEEHQTLWYQIRHIRTNLWAFARPLQSWRWYRKYGWRRDKKLKAALRGKTTKIIDVFEDGEEFKEEVSVDTCGLPLKRLRYESYFIAKGYVKLTLDEVRNMSATYAGQLYLALKTIDEIAAEQHRKEIDNVKRR